jgi:hypothetical protein
VQNLFNKLAAHRDPHLVISHNQTKQQKTAKTVKRKLMHSPYHPSLFFRSGYLHILYDLGVCPSWLLVRHFLENGQKKINTL